MRREAKKGGAAALAALWKWKRWWFNIVAIMIWVMMTSIIIPAMAMFCNAITNNGGSSW